jgi:hypothetical protein
LLEPNFELAGTLKSTEKIKHEIYRTEHFEFAKQSNSTYSSLTP